MADEDFDFGVRERREAKRFEPPPWEADQFEELARKRADAEAAQAAAAAEERAAAEVAAAAAERAEAERATTARSESEDAAPPGTMAIGEGEQPQPEARGAGIEQARVAEMLADLAVEEPPAARSFWKVSVAVGGVMVAFGAVFLFWGMAALVAVKRTGAVGTFGGSVLLLFGAGFVAGGLYIALKNLRQQGVL